MQVYLLGDKFDWDYMLKFILAFWLDSKYTVCVCVGMCVCVYLQETPARLDKEWIDTYAKMKFAFDIFQNDLLMDGVWLANA